MHATRPLRPIVPILALLAAVCALFAARAQPAAADTPFVGSTEAGPFVNLVQRELRRLGVYDGPINGQFTSATSAAVAAFQRSAGIPATGRVTLQTQRAIVGRLGGEDLLFSDAWVTDLQRQLRAWFFTSAFPAGIYNQSVITAVSAFQRASGLEVDGIVGPVTQRALADTRLSRRTFEPRPITTRGSTGYQTISIAAPAGTHIIRARAVLRGGTAGSVRIRQVTVARDRSEYVIRLVFPGEQGTPRMLHTSVVLQKTG